MHEDPEKARLLHDASKMEFKRKRESQSEESARSCMEVKT